MAWAVAADDGFNAPHSGPLHQVMVQVWTLKCSIAKTQVIRAHELVMTATSENFEASKQVWIHAKEKMVQILQKSIENAELMNMSPSLLAKSMNDLGDAPAMLKMG